MLEETGRWFHLTARRSSSRAPKSVRLPARWLDLVAELGGPGDNAPPLVVEQLEPNSFRLVPPIAGTYDVWLTMREGVSGDNFAASAGYVFRWIVPPT